MKMSYNLPTFITCVSFWGTRLTEWKDSQIYISHFHKCFHWVYLTGQAGYNNINDHKSIFMKIKARRVKSPKHIGIMGKKIIQSRTSTAQLCDFEQLIYLLCAKMTLKSWCSGLLGHIPGWLWSYWPRSYQQRLASSHSLWGCFLWILSNYQ